MPSLLQQRARARARTWLLIAVLMATGLIAGIPMGFRWAWGSWALIGALTIALLAMSWFYTHVRKLDDLRIAETLHETAILVAYGPPAAALSYIAVGAGLPLADETFATLDQAMNMDWSAWYRTVHAQPVLASALSLLYHSSLMHIGVALIATGLIGRTERTRELIALLIWTSLPMVVISGLMPALSAWVHYGLGLEKAYHLAHILSLRDGSFRLLEVGNMEGIITFPSFHTAISLVLIWVSRGIAWLFWPTAAIGIGVLASIPSEGGHYFVDMLAGALITVAAVAVMSRVRPDAGRSLSASGPHLPVSVSVD